jgi:hypothetical protein
VSTTEELLRRNSRGSGLENEITAVGIRHVDHATFIYEEEEEEEEEGGGGGGGRGGGGGGGGKKGTNFVEKRWSFGRYSLLAD